jgi:hypothetical protein
MAAIQQLATSLKMGAHVLGRTVGSGPWGQQTQEACIYTLAPHPVELELKHQTAPPCRTDIDVGPGGLAFVIDGILSSEECDALAAVTERMGYSSFAPEINTPPGMRQNQASHWVANEATANAFLRPLFCRFKHLLPQQIDGDSINSDVSFRLDHYKYCKGDVFNPHTDGCWPGYSVSQSGDSIVTWNGVESKLSMLLYLNDASDGVEGGATRLFPFGHHDAPVDIAPRKGSALFFRHGFGDDSVLHMGTKVTSDIPKYVARINVLYETRR